MNHRGAVFTILHLIQLVNSRACFGWVVLIHLLWVNGDLRGQSLGAVSARQEGATIVISISDLPSVETRNLNYFFSMDSGKVWTDIEKDCLQFEETEVRWDVLDCLDLDVFEGRNIQFKVDFSGCSSVLFDGYRYRLVQIGGQCWFAENLQTTVYANGDGIPSLMNSSKWSSTYSGAQAVYNNDRDNLVAYGRLYNWFAVDDPRGLCPSGWHVPSDQEWQVLETALGMSSSDVFGTRWRGTNQGSQMKSSASDRPAWDGSNISRFSGLPGGRYSSSGRFLNEGSNCYWWSSSTYYEDAVSRLLSSGYDNVSRGNFSQRNGFSVRCVRD